MNMLLTLVMVLCGSGLQPLIARIGDAGYLTGGFTQTDEWALTLEEEISEGVMHLAHPDLFLLEYHDPEGFRSGYDGEYLYTVEADVEQVILYPSSGPGSFLHMIERASDSSAVELVEIAGDSMTVIIQGDLGQGITSMTVGYTLSDSLPFLFSTRDANGNRTSYLMRDLEVADSCAPGIFQMTVPDGYMLVEPEGL
jgi:outer membrane lipoprotein-sorting protein